MTIASLGQDEVRARICHLGLRDKRSLVLRWDTTPCSGVSEGEGEGESLESGRNLKLYIKLKFMNEVEIRNPTSD